MNNIYYSILQFYLLYSSPNKFKMYFQNISKDCFQNKEILFIKYIDIMLMKLPKNIGQT